MSLADELPGLLKAARMAVGMRQEEAANRLGVNQTTWSAYERGTRKPPAEVVERMARILEIDTGTLLHSAGYDASASEASRRSHRIQLRQSVAADMRGFPESAIEVIREMVQHVRTSLEVRGELLSEHDDTIMVDPATADSSQVMRILPAPQESSHDQHHEGPRPGSASFPGSERESRG